MEYKFLSKIESPSDVKKLNIDELKLLCEEIRDYLISTVSKNGGHLASNLGTVEISVALHKVFDSPNDSILFDVGHQSYTHKLLTGRYKDFSSIRTSGGISGFMRPSESPHDPFVTGHSSNSISASYGIYKAKCLLGEKDYAITVIGDGAMTGGMVYEALNNAGHGRSRFIVILNDNKMSISRNVGSMANHLTVIRSKSSYRKFKRNLRAFLEGIPFCGKYLADKLMKSKAMLKNAIYHSNVFESLGFNYLGPVDGHDLEKLINIFELSKNEGRPVIIHAITTKGKGYEFAENSPKDYHGVSAFDIDEGVKKSDKLTFSDICGKTLCDMAAQDKKICAITAAMTTGTGLYDFSKKYPERFFDVGIAEEHAATFAGGLAIKGIKPYFVVYSSFLQRSYDQLIHDIAIEGLSVRLCIDRAGIVGEDGESHQGLFDVAFLSTVPKMSIYSPSSFSELEFVLQATVDSASPIAIRYPRGAQLSDFEPTLEDYKLFGEGENLIITYGRVFSNAIEAIKHCENTAVLKLNKIHPIDKEIIGIIKSFKRVYFFEEGIKNGGIAEQIAALLIENAAEVKYKIIAIDNCFVPSASVEDSLKKYGLDTESIIRTVKEDI